MARGSEPGRRAVPTPARPADKRQARPPPLRRRARGAGVAGRPRAESGAAPRPMGESKRWLCSFPLQYSGGPDLLQLALQREGVDPPEGKAQEELDAAPEKRRRSPEGLP